ncbi:hypothetical protein C0995_007025, partial [Termitomyces sp. Mi166
MDVIVPNHPSNFVFYAGLRGPERRYAFIDFEYATLSSDVSPGEMEVQLRDDVRRIAYAIEPNLRCIQDVAPGLGDLLDQMKNVEEYPHFSATSALVKYEQ